MTKRPCSAWRNRCPAKEVDRSQGYVNRARTAAPNDPAAGLAQVRLYSLQHDWANAASVAGALSAQFPSDLNVSEAVAQAQLAAGDTVGALASYKRAYELAPGSAALLSRYVGLLSASKDYRTAANVLKTAIGRDPKNSGLKAALIRITAQTDGVEVRYFAR